MKKGLRRTDDGVYFPDYPKHPLNGANMSAMGSWIGKHEGQGVRDRLVVWEDTDHNQNCEYGYYKDEFEIKCSDFGADIVKVVFCMDFEDEGEVFYLKN